MGGHRNAGQKLLHSPGRSTCVVAPAVPSETIAIKTGSAILGFLRYSRAASLRGARPSFGISILMFISNVPLPSVTTP
ncbi:hypothetical protein J6590_004674, partial [Homalodisca vitripennis]